MLIAALLAVIFMLNLPFGYWRAGQEKFSRGWFLAVHLPVPVIVLLRVTFGFSWTALPFTVLAFFLGQYGGGLLRSTLPSKVPIK
ncbi:MAG TPA: hypothetical protein VGK02_08445 [Candidatus Aquicultor sp.]|jgi:hypothetical protein